MSIPDLWIPILLAAVFVFVVSSVVHMALPIHKSDYRKLPDEDAVLDGMRGAGVQPGHYVFPHCASMQELGSPEMNEKYSRGPVGFVTVIPNGVPAMGKSLLQWFVFSIAVSAVTAYVIGLKLDATTPALDVFRMAGAVSLLGYGVCHLQDSIWKGLAWSISLKFVFDGLLYALATGAAFAWFWPTAA